MDTLLPGTVAGLPKACGKNSYMYVCIYMNAAHIAAVVFPLALQRRHTRPRQCIQTCESFELLQQISKAHNQKKWPANGYTNIHYFYIYIHIDHIVYPLLNTYIVIHKNDTSAKPWHHDTSAKPWHQVFPPCSEPEAGTTLMREPEAGTIPSAAKKGRSNDILRTCECVALPRYLCSGLNPCALYRTLA